MKSSWGLLYNYKLTKLAFPVWLSSTELWLPNVQWEYVDNISYPSLETLVLLHKSRP